MLSRNIKIGLTIWLTLLLSACYGSSKSSIVQSSDYTINSIIQLEENQDINQSIDLLLYYPNDEISNINWQQTAGASVDILANNSKVISFTPSLSGSYSFTVTFTLNGTIEKTLTHSISVTEVSHKVTARLSHEARSENNVSFRAELSSSIDANTLQWQQISGPTVTLEGDDEDIANQHAIVFYAPQVNNDTIITFEVSAEDYNGLSHSDTVAVLVEAAPTISNKAYFSDRVAKVFAYNPDGPYAADLVDCVYSNTLTSSCTLSKTPLLAAEVTGTTTFPAVADIMDRVVVSHQWMGDRFEELLLNYDDNNDIKNLLRATTAIVISYDVRPSFYWAATGAIYLDPENFWLTPNERDTINEAADYRSDYGNDLQFVTPWRYVINNSYASRSFSRLYRVSRTPADLVSLQALLYHELAHANDFFPSNEWYIHNASTRVLDAAGDDWESDELAVSYPLLSQEMRDLAQVSFAGETATNTQKSYLPSNIADFFSTDSASDYYAYSSLREDYAMLFEELMMQSRFGIRRDVAITNQPTGEYVYATDYIVTWGQRGRVGDDNLRERALFTASRVLPEFDSETAINQLPAPIQMTAGDNWVENLTISPDETSLFNLSSSFKSFTTDASVKPTITELVITPIESGQGYYHKPLPAH